MLERLQFTKNGVCALKAAQLLDGIISETEIHGGFLTAVCENKFEEAYSKADDENKKALNACDFIVVKAMYIKPDNDIFETGKTYYLKFRGLNGALEITTNLLHKGQVIRYSSLFRFFHDFKLL
jgi:hypothetical protein